MAGSKAEFTKSGRNSAIMKTKLKNLLTGYKTETVYGADDKLDDVIWIAKKRPCRSSTVTNTPSWTPPTTPCTN